MPSKILGIYWLTQSIFPFAFGIVVTENLVGQRSARIGLVTDKGEMNDAETIRDHGAKLITKDFEDILKLLKEAPNHAT